MIIATEDSEVINQLSSLFLTEDYTITIEKSQTKTILKALEQQVLEMIISLETLSRELESFQTRMEKETTGETE